MEEVINSLFKKDYIVLYWVLFMKCFLFLWDINDDVYKMGYGERILRNLKF